MGSAPALLLSGRCCRQHITRVVPLWSRFHCIAGLRRVPTCGGLVTRFRPNVHFVACTNCRAALSACTHLGLPELFAAACLVRSVCNSAVTYRSNCTALLPHAALPHCMLPARPDTHMAHAALAAQTLLLPRPHSVKQPLRVSWQARRPLLKHSRQPHRAWFSRACRSWLNMLDSIPARRV